MQSARLAGEGRHAGDAARGRERLQRARLAGEGRAARYDDARYDEGAGRAFCLKRALSFSSPLMQQKENDGGVKEERISACVKVSRRRYTGDCMRLQQNMRLPARPNSPSSRLRTSAEKRNASASAHACRTLQRGKNNWKHASLEAPLTQRVPIVHGLSRACRAPASEQPGAHCWLRPRPRPRRSRVCQNTSLEPHRRLARGSASRSHQGEPRPLH